MRPQPAGTLDDVTGPSATDRTAPRPTVQILLVEQCSCRRPSPGKGRDP